MSTVEVIVYKHCCECGQKLGSKLSHFSEVDWDSMCAVRSNDCYTDCNNGVIINKLFTDNDLCSICEVRGGNET